MSNCLLAYPDRLLVSPSYTPVLSGGSWNASYPLANLQNALLGKRARSSDAAVASTLFNADLATPRAVRTIALLRHNASAAAVLRLRGYSDAGHIYLDYDSGGSLPGAATPFAADGSDGTFTRASVAYKQDGSQAASGKARYEAGPLGGTAITIEEGTTNLCLQSNDFLATPWVISGVGGTTGNPDAFGGTAAFRLVPDTTYIGHYVNQAITIVSGQVYTKSFYAKASGYNVLVSVANHIGGSDVTFNLAAGTATGTGGSIKSLGNGWYRCRHTYTANTTAGDFLLYAEVYGNTTLNGTDGYYLHGCQLEAKPYPTSLMPNTSAATTRAAETLTVPSAGVINVTEGTVECWIYYDGDGTISRAIFDTTPSNGSLNGAMLLAVNWTGAHIVTVYGGGGAAYIAASSATPLTAGWHHVAATWSAAGLRLYIDGALAGSNLTTAVTQSAINGSIHLGSLYNDTYQLNNLLSNVRISARARSATEIAAAVLVAPAFDADTTRLDITPALPFWPEGYPAAEDKKRYQEDYYHILPEGITARYWRLDVIDTANPAGYFELGRFILAPAFQPEVNMNWGSSLGLETDTTSERSLGGVDWYNRREPRRVQQFELDWLDSGEAFDDVFNLQWDRGIDKEILFVTDPADSGARLKQRSFLATLRELSPLETPYLNTHSTAFELQEVL